MQPIVGSVALVVAVISASVIYHRRAWRRFSEPPDLAEVPTMLNRGPGTRGGAVALDEPD